MALPNGIEALQQCATNLIPMLGALHRTESDLRYFIPHLGVNPGESKKITIYTPGAQLSDCCETPENAGDFGEKFFEAICFQDGNNFCLEEFASYLNQYSYRFTAGQERFDGELEDFITEQEIIAFNNLIQTLAWQGDSDTTNTNPNTNRLDGIIKQINSDPDSVKLNITSGNVYTAVRNAINSLPQEVWNSGQQIRVYMGEDIANAYYENIFNLNNSNVSAPARNTNDQISYPLNSRVTIVPVYGLIGTNTIIVTTADNIHYGTNMENDRTTMNWGFDDYHQRVYYYIKTIFAIMVARPEYAVIATLDDSVITAANGLPVSVVESVCCPEEDTPAGTAARLMSASGDSALESILEKMTALLENMGAKVVSSETEKTESPKRGRKPKEESETSEEHTEAPDSSETEKTE